MKPYSRIEALTHYPEWHKQPLRLTTPEIENPWLVLQDFFSTHHLTGIRRILDQKPYNIVKDFFSRCSLLHSRTELWDIFAAVIKTNDNNTIKTAHLANYQRLYTLIEALHILHNQQPQAP